MSASSDITAQVRALVTDAVADPERKAALAHKLNVPVESVDRMLTVKRWDLGHALTCADALDLKLTVTVAELVERSTP